jgi:hypothetical protein
VSVGMSTSEPAAPAQTAPAEGAVTTEELQELAQLPEDSVVEVDTPEGPKRMTLKELKSSYRHRAASDQRFTEADKLSKQAKSLESQINGALLAAKKDGGKSVIDWVAKESGKDPLDVLAEQLEKATDPKVIDKLAALLEKKLAEAEKEAAKSPETKEAEKWRMRAEQAEAQLETSKDLKVENEMFESVKATLTEAGLKPSPMNAIQVLELLVEAKSMEPPIELTPKEAALLLKEQIRSNAELLFKPPEAQPGKAKANGAATTGVLDAAKREAKKAEAPRVTVVKKGKKQAEKDESDEDEPQSFLSVLRGAYSAQGKR